MGRYEGQANGTGTGCGIVPAGYIANDGGTGLKACGVGSYSDLAGLNVSMNVSKLSLFARFPAGSRTRALS